MAAPFRINKEVRHEHFKDTRDPVFSGQDPGRRLSGQEREGWKEDRKESCRTHGRQGVQETL